MSEHAAIVAGAGGELGCATAENLAAAGLAPDTAMAYPWKHFIGGHMGRLGTRAEMVLYQQYVNDIIDGVNKALQAVDLTPLFVKYGNNLWAASRQYLAAVVAYACGPVIPKVPRGPRRRRRLYGQHDVRHPRVDPPRPRLRLAGAPVKIGRDRKKTGGGISD